MEKVTLWIQDKKGKWTNDITEWFLFEGKTKKGRQRKWWEDNLRELAEPIWRRLTQDRE